MPDHLAVIDQLVSWLAMDDAAQLPELALARLAVDIDATVCQLIRHAEILGTRRERNWPP
jgi:hypothetical protein